MLPKAITIYLFVCISFCSAKSINLLEHYKEPLPVTFGMWLDLQLKLFSYKHSDWSKKTKVFIAKSGALQHDLVSTFVFLDGKQVGWAAGDNFHWKRKKRTWDVITNHFRGKSKPKAAKTNSRKR